MDIIYTLVVLVFCHLVGDYIFQSDYLAKTKGENWYHMLVRCVLYCLPFFLVFGLTWQLLYIFALHFVTDNLKARYDEIDYAQDQIIHYFAMLVYLMV